MEGRRQAGGVSDKQWTWLPKIANWFFLRLLLLLTIALSIISMGISSWQADANAGDFQLILDLAKLDWNSDICDAMPYQALRPFRFTFAAKGINYSSSAFCPWPQSKTIYRVVLAIVQALFFSLLLVKRFAPYSIAFAPPVHFVLTFLWWAALVVDTQSLSVSNAACASNFGEGIISALSKSRDLQLNCNSSLYGATNAIDFCMFCATFVIFRAWSQCSNKFGLQSDKGEPAHTMKLGTAEVSAGAAGAKRLSTPAWWRASENTRLSELFPRNSVQLAGGRNIALAHAAPPAPVLAENDSDLAKSRLTWFMRWWLSIGRYLERIVGTEQSSDEALEEATLPSPAAAPSRSTVSLDTTVPSGHANRLAVGGTVAANPLNLGTVSGGYSTKTDKRDYLPPKQVFTPPLKPPKPAATRGSATPEGASEITNPFAAAEDAETPAEAEAESEAPPPEPLAPPPPLPVMQEIEIASDVEREA